MSSIVKEYFNLNNPDDLELVRQLIQDSSDIEDFGDDEDEVFAPPGSSVFSSKREGPDIEMPTEEDSAQDDADVPGPPEFPNVDGTEGKAKEVDDTFQPNPNDEALKCYYRMANKKSAEWEKKPMDTERTVTVDQPDEITESVGTPLDYFYYYIPTDCLESTVFYTNLYATQNETKNFKMTDKDEIEQLFGLHLFMGALKFPRVQYYWNRSFKIDIVPETMARDRFFQLRTNLHFLNNLEIPKESKDRFYKVRPIYDAIRSRCLSRKLEEKFAIDEQIVPFRGNLEVKQYIKGKPCPWGIKIFFLCGKSGLPYDFIIYQGSSTEINVEAKKSLGVAGGVVYTLAERLNNSGPIELYYDNYFSNFHLLKIMKDRGINAAGTIRLNRFYNPPFTTEKEFLKKPRGYSEEVTTSDNKVTVVKWLDNKSVVLASNFLGIGEVDLVQRWDKVKKKYLQIERPQIVREYNHTMGGVDLLDQLISLYRTAIRSRKWTVRMWTHALDLATVCSWLEYRKDAAAIGTPKKEIMDLLEFRIHLAYQLIAQNKCNDSGSGKKKRGRPSSSNAAETSKRRKKLFEVAPISGLRYDGVGHLALHDQQKTPSRCKHEGCTERTHIKYIKCKVHLCINSKRNCFFSYHCK